MRLSIYSYILLPLIIVVVVFLAIQDIFEFTSIRKYLCYIVIVLLIIKLCVEGISRAVHNHRYEKGQQQIGRETENINNCVI